MSNEAKFTKGPWCVVNYGNEEFRHISVRGEFGGFEVSGCDNALSNAHLIAAAPEMYAELQEISNWINSQLGMGDWHKDIEKLLAKARGEHDIN